MVTAFCPRLDSRKICVCGKAIKARRTAHRIQRHRRWGQDRGRQEITIDCWIFVLFYRQCVQVWTSGLKINCWINTWKPHRVLREIDFAFHYFPFIHLGFVGFFFLFCIPISMHFVTWKCASFLLCQTHLGTFRSNFGSDKSLSIKSILAFPNCLVFVLFCINFSTLKYLRTCNFSMSPEGFSNGTEPRLVTSSMHFFANVSQCEYKKNDIRGLDVEPQPSL